MSEADTRRLVADYAKAMSQHALLPGCGACGVRDPQKPTHETCVLEDLPPASWLRYSDEEREALDAMPTVRLIDESGQPREAPTKRLRSYWAASGTDLFHVHPELVDVNTVGQHCVLLCSACHSAASQLVAAPPRHYIAGGGPTTFRSLTPYTQCSLPAFCPICRSRLSPLGELALLTIIISTIGFTQTILW